LLLNGEVAMSGKVVHFEIPVDSGDCAAAFYGKAFGWTLEPWGSMEYWMTAAGGKRLTERMPMPG
jgi:predicted enzyme related to lactoylglutathione lyase